MVLAAGAVGWAGELRVYAVREGAEELWPMGWDVGCC